MILCMQNANERTNQTEKIPKIRMKYIKINFLKYSEAQYQQHHYLCSDSDKFMSILFQ